MATGRQATPGEPSTPSRFDTLFGRHFKDFIVAILIVVLLASFLVVYYKNEVMDPAVLAFFNSAIMGLIGYFAANKSRSK